MKIKKILNNNTVIAIHESGEEVIVMESGLGFRRKKGDSISRNFMWIAMTWETAHWKEPKKKSFYWYKDVIESNAADAILKL